MYFATCHATRGSQAKANQENNVNNDGTAIGRQLPPCSTRICISEELNASHFPQPQADNKKRCLCLGPNYKKNATGNKKKYAHPSTSQQQLISSFSSRTLVPESKW